MLRYRDGDGLSEGGKRPAIGEIVTPGMGIGAEFAWGKGAKWLRYCGDGAAERFVDRCR